MKRYLGLGLVALSAALIAGCPIYPQDRYCESDWDCSDNAHCNSDNVCIDDPTPATGGTAGSGNPDYCTTQSTCGANAVCGSDGKCHPSDCSFWGCYDEKNYECVKAGTSWTCQKKSTLPDGGTGGSSPDAGPDASPDAPPADALPDQTIEPEAEAAAPIYCGNPKDCAPGKVCTPAGTCQSGSCDTLGCVYGYLCVTPDGGVPTCTPVADAACISDNDCLPLGSTYKCLDGSCTQPLDQCTDKTQCDGAAVCVEGKCTTGCTSDAQCPDSFKCNLTLNVCNTPAKPCTITNDCGSASEVCVDGACVAKCGTNGTCAAGLVCVANGCVPQEKPKFVCTVDGQQDKCSSVSVCLHHSCYISCAPPNDHACDNKPPELSVCKLVTTSSGDHNVCGSPTNLGSECDTTANKLCTGGKICIDGFCK